MTDCCLKKLVGFIVDIFKTGNITKISQNWLRFVMKLNL